MNEADVVEHIYEAAINADMWVAALDLVVRATEAASGELFIFDGKDVPPLWRATPYAKDTVAAWIADGAWRTAVMGRMLDEQVSPGFLSTMDMLAPEQLRSDPTVAYFNRIGLYSQLFSPMPMPTGEMVYFSFERMAADGRFPDRSGELLDRLLPHFSRAALIAARLRLQRARAATDALQAIGIPAAVMNRNGKVLAVNESFSGRSDVFLDVAFGGLAIADSDADDLFQRALIETGAMPAVRSIPVAPREDRCGLVLHVLPLLRTAREIMTGSDILVVANVVGEQRGAVDGRILTALFDLTPAEARFAAALSRGRSVAECARDLGLTEKTGRTYLERIYAKTGKRRQIDLVAMLRDTGGFPREPS